MIVGGVDPKDMDSPIRWVMGFVPGAIARSAPERADEANERCKDLTLKFHDEHRWVLRIDGRGVIHLSRHVVEVFWAASYAYMTVYTTVFQGRSEVRERTVDLHSDPLLKDAMSLLQWAFESMLNQDGQRWPPVLPQPVESPASGSMENVADELCLVAIAFTLHHEIAHNTMGHSGSDIDSERDADHEAADFLLANVDDESKRTKRLLGIATALCVMTASRIHLDDFSSKSHPRAFDRLFNCLDRWVSEPDHVVWAVTTAILRLHLDNAPVGVPTQVHDSFRDCVDHYVEVLAERAEDA